MASNLFELLGNRNNSDQGMDHGSGVPENFFSHFLELIIAVNESPGGTEFGLVITEKVLNFHKGLVSTALTGEKWLIVEMRILTLDNVYDIYSVLSPRHNKESDFIAINKYVILITMTLAT
jgi:hypothetical protein